MSISIFDIFSIGIGPSSSHTVGPMLAANRFIKNLNSNKLLDNIKRIKVELYGSLALTGKGHATDKAVLLGLEGFCPETVDPQTMGPRMQEIIECQKLHLNNKKLINFSYEKDLLFLQKELLPKHTNGMRFLAFDADDDNICNEVYYSIGGGFIVRDDEFDNVENAEIEVPYNFESADELLKLCKKHKFSIPEFRCCRLRNLFFIYKNYPIIYLISSLLGGNN